MSTSERRGSRRLRSRHDGGFTLVEVMVAMGLLMVVLMASLPAFIAMMRAGVSARLQTQAKNLAQERLEQIRDLRFHVDRQNGPFLDLLDVYYTNASTAAAAIPVTVGSLTLSGRYVSSAAASGGEPAGPFYRVTIDPICIESPACPAGTQRFKQIVDLQFLQQDGSAVPAARFENKYDSQTVGSDAPPSTTVGVTVITSWSQSGTAKSYRTYTRITDSRPAAPLIQTQARAVAVDISSTAADGTTLELQGGLSSADGAQSSGSSVSGYATGATATRTGYDAVSGQSVQFSLPTQAASTSGTPAAQSAGAGCSWFGFGKTGLSNGGGDVSTGLPKSPSNVDSGTPPNQMQAYLSANGGSSTCGLLSFDNTVGGGVLRPSGDNVGSAMGSAPFVRVPDTSGSAPVVVGSTYVTSNDLTASPQKSQAGAKASSSQPVVLFPGYTASGGGLVKVTLNSAQVDCTSATTSGALGAVSGKYNVTLAWWGKGSGDASARWHTATYVYDSTAGTPLSRTGDTWDPANTDIGSGLKLNQVVTSPSAATATSALNTGATDDTGGKTGLRGFANGVLTLSTASTLVNETGSGYSSVKVQIGKLTCVADDQR